MRRTARTLLLLMVLDGLSLQAMEVKDEVVGEWLGGLDSGGGWVVMRVRLLAQSSRLEGTADLPGLGVSAAPLSHIEFDPSSSTLRFEMPMQSSAVPFSGRLADLEIAGTARLSGVERPFQLLRSEKVDRKSLSGYEGAYKWGPDRFVYVQFWDELGKDQLTAFDESGAIRALYPMGRDQFFVGEGIAFPAPMEAKIAFQRDSEGKVASLAWQQPGLATRLALRADVDREEEVSFRNGRTTLAGTLITPTAAGQHPVIVVVHGSGPQDRGGSLPFIRFLVRHGVALLVYDKRGVGASTGDWRKASFSDLADDALAAVRFLRSRADIDSRRIGIFGISQGGWIAPLAASRSTHIAFLISISGPGVTPAQETLDYLQNEMRVDGFSSDEIGEAAALTTRAFDYARTGRNWDRYLDALRKSQEKIWFPFMALTDRKSDWQWEFRRLINDYEPEPALRRLRCPVLALFGGRDLNVVATKNSSRWESALREGGNKDHTLLTFPEGNHVLIEAETGSALEFPRLKTFVPDYSRVLLQWVMHHVRAGF